MKLSRKAGTTSQTVYLFIRDSSSTTGAGLTGLVFNTASLTAYYVRTRGSATSITLATLAAANSAWSSGGFKEVDATNMPGVYRFDIPDAALASGADSVAIVLKGAANMAPLPIEIELTGWDNQDATRGGMSALPNAAAGANGGLPTGNGSGQVTVAGYASGQAPLQPTVAGRTLDVSTGGEAGLDWANIGSPTTAVNLSGTTVKTATDVETDTQDIQGRLPAALVSGRIDASVGAMAADVLTSSALAATAATEIANAVWDEPTAGNTTSGTFGAAMVAAGSAGDPWATSLPGAYGAGTAGKIVGDNLNATVGSRATQTSVDTVDDFLDTEIAAIKAKTDNLPVAPANEATLTTIAGYLDTEVAAILAAVDTEVAAIKAKTDLIPSDPADASDISALIDALPTAAENAAALLDLSNGVETGLTPRQALRLMAAALGGKLSGAATTTIVVRNTADTANRITATVDADGNRSAVTLNL